MIKRVIKIKKEGKVTERQFSAIIINTVLGVGILTLPRVAIYSANQGAILSVILAAILFLVNLLILIKLGLIFPNKTIFEYLEIILGKVIGKILSIFIITYWFIYIALAIRTFSELIITAILPTTPLEIIMIIMLFLVVYLSYKDIQVLARINELYIFIIIIPIFLLTVLSFRRSNFIYLLPIFRHHSVVNILKSTARSYTTFLGFEIVAILIPFITTKKLSFKYGIKAWIVPSILSILIVVASISVFGVFELKNLVWPTFELIKATKVFAFIFERLEVAFIAIWVITIFTTAANLLFGVTLGGTQLFNLHKHKTLVLPLLPILYLIALAPRNAYQLFDIVEIVSLIGMVVITVLPILLLILVKARGIRGDNNVSN